MSSYATPGFHHRILSQHLSGSVDPFEFLCSNLTFINAQLIQSSSLLFHGETVWYRLEKISCLPVLFDVVWLFQSFPFFFLNVFAFVLFGL